MCVWFSLWYWYFITTKCRSVTECYNQHYICNLLEWIAWKKIGYVFLIFSCTFTTLHNNNNKNMWTPHIGTISPLLNLFLCSTYPDAHFACFILKNLFKTTRGNFKTLKGGKNKAQEPFVSLKIDFFTIKRWNSFIHET